MKDALHFLAMAVVALAASDAFAQEVYRCGNEYRAAPCPGGKAVPKDDLASPADRLAEGRAVAAREKRLADDMERDRRAREAAVKPAGASSLGPTKPEPAPGASASATLKPKKKAKGKIRVVDEKDFVADVPKAAKPR
jgi:hypothetical protein